MEDLERDTDKMYEVPVTVNFETEEYPTVQVALLDPMPQIVEVEVLTRPNMVDVSSPIPQFKLVLKDATYELSDDVHMFVIEPNLVVAVSFADYDYLTENKVPVFSVVKKAVNKGGIYPKKLEIVENASTIVDVEGIRISVPSTLSQVIEVVAENGRLRLVSLSDKIPFGHSLIPLVTPGNGVDAVLAINADELVEWNRHVKLFISDVVKQALVESNSVILHNDILDLVGTPEEVQLLVPKGGLAKVDVEEDVVVEVPKNWANDDKGNVFEVVRVRPRSKKLQLQLVHSNPKQSSIDHDVFVVGIGEVIVQLFIDRELNSYLTECGHDVMKLAEEALKEKI